MAPQATASLPTTLRSPPSLDSYIPVAEHQSRTPVSFYDGPPVLHYHTTGARAYLSRENRDKLPWGGTDTTGEATGGKSWPIMGEGMVEQLVDVFVGSDPVAGCGVALPYPVIGLHAIKSGYTVENQRVPTIYLQLELSGTGEEDEPDTVELTIVPAGTDTTPVPDATDATVAAPPQSNSEASCMFDAISTCADLHPDRFDGEDDDADGGDSYPSFFRQSHAVGDDGEEYEDEYDGADNGEDDDRILIEGEGGATLLPLEGFRGVFSGGGRNTTTAAVPGLPPPMPGSSGWITAENAHEFFDEDGNWRGRDSGLGGGAGRVRGRDEVEAGERVGTNATGLAEPTQADGCEASAAPTPNGHDLAGTIQETESKRIRTE